MEEQLSASGDQLATAWPRYNAAALGFRNYWYPVKASRRLGSKPRSVTLCGEKIVLVRNRGKVYGLRDRCPHRGVPLSAGKCEFPGTLTCAYHGWTYDLSTGDLVAALTDGPDSPIVGRASVRVQSYPVEERAGLIWVYVGDDPPPPVEQDVPEELLRPDTVIEPLIELRKGNWRYGFENGIDEAHAKYLHRKTPYQWVRQMPAYSHKIEMLPSDDGLWLVRRVQLKYSDVYPRIGRWPSPPHFWQTRKWGPRELGGRLPCILRVHYLSGWTDYEIFVPVDEDHHLAVMLAVKWADPIGRILFRLWYRLYTRPIYYGMQNRAQDQWMIELMQIPPERLFRPDVSITAWRKWCHDKARLTSSEARQDDRTLVGSAVGERPLASR